MRVVVDTVRVDFPALGKVSFTGFTVNFPELLEGNPLSVRLTLPLKPSTGVSVKP